MLFKDPAYKDVSAEAKILYGMMLDRMSLSSSNHWIDDQNRVYIYYSIGNIMDDFGCSKNKALQLIRELDQEKGIGLIRRVKQEPGKPAIIYVKKFIPETPVQKMNQSGSKNEPGGGSKNEPGVVQNLNPNNTEINNTEIQYISSFHPSNTLGDIEEGTDRTDMMNIACKIRENIDYDVITSNHPRDIERINEIVDVLVETIISERPVKVSGQKYPVEYVREKLLRLDASHMEYVLNVMRSNRYKIRNVKGYLLTLLFNAPSTISTYYQAEANYDLAH